MKRYFLVAMLFFAAQMSYGQMITLPWDINVCRGCRAEIPVDPSIRSKGNVILVTTF